MARYPDGHNRMWIVRRGDLCKTLESIRSTYIYKMKIEISCLDRYPRRPTQRAADKWESPRFFLAVFNTSAESRFQALSASHPPATNASRWAADIQ